MPNYFGSPLSETINASDGADTIWAYGGNDTVSGLGGDDLIFGGSGNDRLFGGSGDDSIYAGSGNDTVAWEAGEDLNVGGEGEDTILANGLNLASGATFNLQDGTYTYFAFQETWSDFEHYIGATGTGDEEVIGTSGANTIWTGSGDNTIAGFSGNDTLISGAGDDSVYAGFGDDQVFGGGGDDLLRGHHGNDILDGAFGADTIEGGEGDDIIRFHDGASGSQDGDASYGGAGIDTIDAQGFDFNGGFFSLNAGVYTNFVTGDDEVWEGFENYENPLGEGTENVYGNAQDNVIRVGSGENWIIGYDGNDDLYGGGGDDTVWGEDGDDLLDGGAGDDEMNGGLGNDVYIVGSLGDVTTGEVAYGSGGGIDTVRSYVDWTLGTNFEVLRLMGGADINGTGNAAPENIVGNSGDNTLSGNGGNDVLNGKAGADVLIGGTGQDTLVGESGADVFLYNSITESFAGAATRDLINGFSHGTDTIDLSAIDANPFLPGDQAFDFGGLGALSGDGADSAGELRFQRFGGDWNILSGDINGDGTADFQIFINGTNFMTGTDFIL